MAPAPGHVYGPESCGGDRQVCYEKHLDTGQKMTAFSPLLSSSTVSKETTLSERSIQRGVQAGTFPSPVSISVLAGGSGRVAWRASDVQAWIDSRPSIKTSIKGEVSA